MNVCSNNKSGRKHYRFEIFVPKYSKSSPVNIIKSSISILIVHDDIFDIRMKYQEIENYIQHDKSSAEDDIEDIILISLMTPSVSYRLDHPCHPIILNKLQIQALKLFRNLIIIKPIDTPRGNIIFANRKHNIIKPFKTGP